MRVSLIIPALDEAKCLCPLLAEVPLHLIDQLIVVDNGSTDNTAELARTAGAQVVSEPRRGYGFACAAGAAAAIGDVLVFMDGDGSFLPAELPRLLAPLAEGAADLVLGSRILDNHQRAAILPHQRFGNDLFAWFLQRRFGLILTDLGPYRAIRRELLLELDMQELTYGWSWEMIIKTVRLGRPIVELPVTYRRRIAGQSKVAGSLRGSVQAAYCCFGVMGRYGFQKL
ncbi:MAG TPA: glycosyltransferase family 2 protein [Anaerolineales bacterium]|nr:glycosyltransferase family 2 protein [Anaerolineales bacterium]